MPDRAARVTHQVAPSITLPFALDIPVRSYLDHALPLSIAALSPQHVDALLSRFIQLFFPHDKLAFDRVIMCPDLRLHDWRHLGFVDVQDRTAFAAQLGRASDLTVMSLEHLSAGSYLDICMDEFYLPGRPCWQRDHSVHDNMLIGYDLASRRFHLAGYGMDYEVTMVGFTDVERAFYDAPLAQRHVRRLNIVMPRAAGVTATMDSRGVASQLDDYVTSHVTVTPDAMREAPPYRQARRFSGTWGLATYDAFVEYFRRTARERGELDLRATRTLWEHKACMLQRLRRLEADHVLPSGGVLSRSYRAVEMLARSVRFSAYEYNLDRTVTLDATVDALRDMRAAEEPILLQVLQHLRPTVP